MNKRIQYNQISFKQFEVTEPRLQFKSSRSSWTYSGLMKGSKRNQIGNSGLPGSVLGHNLSVTAITPYPKFQTLHQRKVNSKKCLMTKETFHILNHQLYTLHSTFIAGGGSLQWKYAWKGKRLVFRLVLLAEGCIGYFVMVKHPNTGTCTFTNVRSSWGSEELESQRS